MINQRLAPSRRDFFKASCATAALSAVSGCSTGGKREADRPNVVLVMTDDQGYGDVGFHGNDLIRTPNLDGFAAENIEITRFYVCPTCAPTRAGLMTGRYHHRTGVMGTMSGEALIDPEEMTIASLLSQKGYRCGIFGKWHLGDNYPRRPVDMGFDEAVVHLAGGLSQPSCPPGVGYDDPAHREKYNYVVPPDLPHWVSSNNYFDPILQHNGESEQYEGYCTDIFFDAAIDYIGEHRHEPFFVYLPLNAPHAPEIVSETYLEPYRALGLDDQTARCYGMITNIDDNFGRLRRALREYGLADNTILVFMCDNGQLGRRYTDGLRGGKATFYESGIRTPFVFSWPARFSEFGKTELIAANIDILPTIAEACGVGLPGDRIIDGKSLMPLMRGDGNAATGRTLFFQGNHGRPEAYNHCAVVTSRYKLVDGKELYDLQEDPSEKIDIAGKQPDIVAELRGKYEAWFADACKSGDMAYQRIWVGTEHENPVRLTRQDWRGERSRFVRKDTHGWWDLDVRCEGQYEVTVTFVAANAPAALHLTFGDVHKTAEVPAGDESCRFGPLTVPEGAGILEAWLDIDGGKTGISDVTVLFIDDNI